MEAIHTRAHEELWAEAREDLRSRLGEGRFQRWIAPLKVLSARGEEIRLAVANRYVLDWIESSYLASISSALLSVLDLPAEVEAQEVPRVQLVVDAVPYDPVQELAVHELPARDFPGQHSPAQDSQNGGSAGAQEGPWLAAPPASESSGQTPASDQKPRPLRETPGAGGCSGSKQDDGEAACAQTLDSFVVGPTNQLAHSAVLQVLERPGSLYNPLFVHGPSGVGKTHLLKGLHRALRSRRRRAGRATATSPRSERRWKAAYVTGEQFFFHYSSSVQDGTSRKFRDRYRSLDVLIVDDVQLLIGKRKTQLEFLHTLRFLVESGKQVILASDVPPRSLKELDASLVGRFLHGLVVGIKKPDFATRLGVLRGQAKRLPTRIGDRILRFLAEHVRGSARELIGSLMKLGIHAQLRGGSLEFEEARDILADFERDQRRKIDMAKIRDVVARHCGVLPDVLVSRSRQRQVAYARQVAMYLSRRHTTHTLGEIGKFFGRRNHTTVRCAELKIARMLEARDLRVKHDVSAILEQLDE